MTGEPRAREEIYTDVRISTELRYHARHLLFSCGALLVQMGYRCSRSSRDPIVHKWAPILSYIYASAQRESQINNNQHSLKHIRAGIMQQNKNNSNIPKGLHPSIFTSHAFIVARVLQLTVGNKFLDAVRHRLFVINVEAARKVSSKT